MLGRVHNSNSCECVAGLNAALGGKGAVVNLNLHEDYCLSSTATAQATDQS